MRDVYRELVAREARCVPVRLIQQPASQMCWAACYRMVTEWRFPNTTKTWCDYSALRKTSCAACEVPGDACNQPREVTSVLADLQKLGFTKTVEEDHPLTWAQVLASITSGAPVQIFLAYRGDPQPGHYFLIIGTSFLRNSAQGAWLVADPAKESIRQIEVTRLGQTGDWSMSWRIA